MLLQRSTIGPWYLAFALARGRSLHYFKGRSLTGGALVGDVELRLASHSSGTCAGFVDSSTCLDPGTDRTPASPYAWRD